MELLYQNTITKQEVDYSADIENSGTHSAPFNTQRSTLLIVDRSVDFASPFAHEYSYGHMLFEVPDCEK